MNIGQRLSLGFGTLILLGSITGFAIFDASQKALKKAIGETSVLLVEDIMDKIDRNIQRRIEEMQGFCLDKLLQRELMASSKEFAELDNAQDYIKEMDGQWVSQSKETVSPFMRRLIDNELSGRLRQRIDFYEKKVGYKVFAEIFITNKYGANMAQSEKTSDYYQADEEWWQKAKDEGLYIGNVGYDESAGVYSTDIGIRINDERRNFIGVAKVVLNIAEAINIIGEGRDRHGNESNDKVEFRLFTGSGKVLYSTEPFSIFENVSGAYLKCLDPRHGYYGGYYFANGDLPGEGKVLFAYAHSRGYKDYRGLGWILAIKHREKDIFVPVSTLRNTLLLLLLGLLAGSVLVALFVSRLISAPVAKLKDAAKAIGEGRLDTRVHIESRDELGMLAASFNKMAEDLQNVQDMFVQSEKLNAIGTLASGVAHEVRNPLGIIKQGLDFLESKLPLSDEDVRSVFEMMNSNISRADNIIRTLVDFSRASVLRLETHDINSILDASLILVRSQLKVATSIEIITRFEQGLPAASVDRLKMEQVFVNLLLNSIQAMPSGGKIFIRSKAQAEKDSKKAIVVEIEDTGEGIPEENFKRIFDPFFTTKAPGEGTGLGLAVTKNIILMHGGTIEVRSKVGEGTIVQITLNGA